jgi:hypothetical protein
MTTETINEIYELADKSGEVLKNLKQVLFMAKRLDINLTDDADDLYMRLRVVLDAIESHAFNLDEQAQFEANPWTHNAPYNPQFLGAQPAKAGQDY